MFFLDKIYEKALQHGIKGALGGRVSEQQLARIALYHGRLATDWQFDGN